MHWFAGTQVEGLASSPVSQRALEKLWTVLKILLIVWKGVA
jgi:hypothetical protein